MTHSLSGGCACGTVRYEMLSEPMLVHCCHCLNCQRQTGSAFALDAIIETDRLKLLSGDFEITSAPTGSGRDHDIYRCANCGVEIWSVYSKTIWQRFVKVGTLDDPSAIYPSVHIYTRSKLPWVTIPAGELSFEAGYDMAQVWPEAALERRQVALRKFERDRFLAPN